MTRVKICGITSKTEITFLNKYLPDYIGFVFTTGSKRRVTPEQAAELASGLSPAIKKVGVFVDAEPERAAEIASAVRLDVLQLHGREDGRYIGILRPMLKPGTEIWKAIRMGGNRMPELGTAAYGRPGMSESKTDVNTVEQEMLMQGRSATRISGVDGRAPGSGMTGLPDCGPAAGAGTVYPLGCGGTSGSETAGSIYGGRNPGPEMDGHPGCDRLLLDTYVADCPGGSGKAFDWGLALPLKQRTHLPVILAGGLHPGNVRQAIEQVFPFAVDASSGVEGDGIKDERKVKAFIEAVRGVIKRLSQESNKI